MVKKEGESTSVPFERKKKKKESTKGAPPSVPFFSRRPMTRREEKKRPYFTPKIPGQKRGKKRGKTGAPRRHGSRPVTPAAQEKSKVYYLSQKRGGVHSSERVTCLSQKGGRSVFPTPEGGGIRGTETEKKRRQRSTDPGR